jgi:hypothetical protein
MKKHGYATHGSLRHGSSGYQGEGGWFDKDPFYRTTDIFNGVFKKAIRLDQASSPTNSTDLKKIYLNYGEIFFKTIISLKGPGRDGFHSEYVLECGHTWEGKTDHTPGKDVGRCSICSANQVYLAFEHEWQHIIFKSDLATRQLFVQAYVDDLSKNTAGLDTLQLQDFISLLINAFDDLRCNSLWEKVYPGSAQQIWERWQRLTATEHGDKINTNFLSFIFAKAFDVHTDPDGEFATLEPIVRWGIEKVKYRGFANMLVDVRVVLDRCMGVLLQSMRQPQPGVPNARPQQGAKRPDAAQDPGGGSPGGDPGQGSGAEPGDHNDTGEDGDSTGTGADPQPTDEEQESDPGTNPGDGATPSIEQAPSASTLNPTPEEMSKALQKLAQGAQALDPKETHRDPDTEQLSDAQTSQAVKATIRRALNADLADAKALDQMLGNEVDPDMQQALTQLMNGVAQKSETSQLTQDAKARILLIEVQPSDVADDPEIELSTDEINRVRHIRSAFFRALGRQKASRAPEGLVIDVPALIAYKLDHEDSHVFEGEAIQQGFAYSILCDMSGSMQDTFPLVCHAVEMLKQALKFPFVVGNLWGFRGGEGSAGRPGRDGEVWIYRYHPKVKGYLGTARSGKHGNFSVPVTCGGLTPMNPALRVTINHLSRKMPSGMAKRLFLLTDGSPCSTRVGGGHQSANTLRRFVAKEIEGARKHGIQVFTLVIGRHAIAEEECREMFGQPRFWKRVDEPDRVGAVLARLVLENFQRYIKIRG